MSEQLTYLDKLKISLRWQFRFAVIKREIIETVDQMRDFSMEVLVGAIGIIGLILIPPIKCFVFLSSPFWIPFFEDDKTFNKMNDVL